MRITSPTCLGPTCTTISLPGTVCQQGELPSDWGKSGAFRALEHLSEGGADQAAMAVEPFQPFLNRF